MNWLTNIVSSGVSEIIEATGSVLDDLITSDEERDEAKAKLTSIINDFETKVMAEANKFEAEITKRHENDMKSDSWLSKNIRPLTLAVTGGTIYLLVYLTVFMELSETQVQVLDSWIPMLTGLFTTMVVFYFGSRGLEKVNKLRKQQ